MSPPPLPLAEAKPESEPDSRNERERRRCRAPPPASSSRSLAALDSEPAAEDSPLLVAMPVGAWSSRESRASGNQLEGAAAARDCAAPLPAAAGQPSPAPPRDSASLSLLPSSSERFACRSSIALIADELASRRVSPSAVNRSGPGSQLAGSRDAARRERGLSWLIVRRRPQAISFALEAGLLLELSLASQLL